ncbi:hypothetical protein ACEE90_04760 [Corynebacterium phoceense]|uniref:hypothetical protein n=1 Tax=Corynebacterium phoceense TaxID=1686286 RepID=UPI00211B7CEF|nr:hypothetical protein [Corynebacterium phoceense]MCQ9335663.1 hypothetical protein [Corynebacterium phoceense]
MSHSHPRAVGVCVGLIAALEVLTTGASVLGAATEQLGDGGFSAPRRTKAGLSRGAY